jgi:hypothetical protein
MNDQLTTAIENDEVDLSDTSASDIRDDYEAFKRFLAEQNEPLPSMATTGLPGGGIAFSNRHCKTAEEADAAFEAFLREVLELTDEDY